MQAVGPDLGWNRRTLAPHMDIDQTYEGREHSLVKHKLLEGYLEKLLFIKGVTGTSEMTYVDCFAGPWGDETDDLKGTSIAISLSILKKVRESLAAKHKIYDTRYRAIFVERKRSRFLQLKKYIESNCPSRIEAIPLEGDYTELQDEIISNCGNGFTFFFIDPKEWTTVGIQRFSKLLACRNSEFIITFMYDFLNRAIGKEALRTQVSCLLGDLDDTDIGKISEMGARDRELWVVRRYQEELKAAMLTSETTMPRSYRATILDKDKERTKYHLVYLTRHPKGIVEFARLSENVEIFQRRVRSHVRLHKKELETRMDDMFGIDDQTIVDAGVENIEKVKAYWLKKLDTKGRPYSQIDLADILESTGWLESDLQTAFNELSKSGKVENLDGSSKRHKRFVHFDKNERLRRLT